MHIDIREDIGHRTKGHDVRNVKRKVQENIIINHEDDATSVSFGSRGDSPGAFQSSLGIQAAGSRAP